MSRAKYIGPVAIGGVGGSGTRVVAEICRQGGLYLGNDLNSANDNLWFTTLFKRPRWLRKTVNLENEIFIGLSIFEKIMNGNNVLTFNEYRFLAAASLEIAIFGHGRNGEGRGLWSIERIKKMIRKSSINVSHNKGWGWKEPNTHIFVEYLNEYFNNFKYIHVIRHGLDMAYSNNQAQLYNWGSLFGVKKPESLSDLPSRSLEYWIKANKRIISLGRNVLRDRFLLVNFDQLCSNQSEELNRILVFLNQSVDKMEFPADLYQIIRKPESTGRYKKQDLSCFSKRNLDEVERLGFKI